MNDDSATSSMHMPEPAIARAFMHILGRLQHGYLIVFTPEKEKKTFGYSKQNPQAVLAIHDWRACGRILAHNNIGFAQAYIEGWIDSPDLLSLFRLILMNEMPLYTLIHGNSLANFFRILGRHIRTNTRRRSIKNAKYHYEGRKDFFQLFLDSNLNYSTGIFNNNYQQSLEIAQYEKYERIIQRLSLKPGMKILEIGCGYGGFLVYAAQRGFTIEGISLSQTEIRFSQEKINTLNLQASAHVYFADYRSAPKNTYDAIICLEVLPEIGEKHWTTFFKIICQRLNHQGKALLHSMVINEEHYLNYRSSHDFIRAFIAPGMILPSPARVSFNAEEKGLKTIEMNSIAEDYLETVRLWRINFEFNLETSKNNLIDKYFIKLWRLYLIYIEMALETKRANGLEIVLQKMT